jgi:hypothetical protein
VAAFFGATYWAAGYLHYQHIAVDESRAAQRAERANIDLQDALDRLRDALATARPYTKPPGNEPSGQIAKAEQYKVDRVAQLTRMSNGKEPGPRIGIQSGPLSGVGSGLSR